MAGGGGVHRVGYRITVPPDCFARFEIVGGGDFILALPRVQVDAGADDQRRRMAYPDGDLPSLLQLIGPRFRRDEARDDAVAVGAAPSRPILRVAGLIRRADKN